MQCPDVLQWTLVCSRMLTARLSMRDSQVNSREVTSLTPDHASRTLTFQVHAHKVAGIFAGRNLSGNLAEIADYTLNRIGAVGLAWGAYSQKAASIGTGCNMYGIPAVLGPHSGKYRRALIAKTYDDSKWKVYDSRNGSEMAIPPSPEFLITTAETWQEACCNAGKELHPSVR